MAKSTVKASSPTELTLNPQSLRLPASDGGGSRSVSQIKIIVLHSSEMPGGSAYLQNLSSVLNAQGLSVQIGVNTDGSCARYFPDNEIAYDVTAYNDQALGIEQAGYAAQSSWPKTQTETTAKWIAFWANKYNIPIVHSTTNGVCTHKDLGAAGGGHVDPGPGYPFSEVLKEANGLLGRVTEGGGEGEALTTSEAAGGVTGTVSLANIENTAKAAAFSTFIELPGIEESEESMALKGGRSLMNDKPLMPFIEQLTQGTLRRFQSLPNGNFYAFYPDYFGGMKQRTPYWEIMDIEVLEGEISLTDEALATHVYVVGDNAGYLNGIDVFDKVSAAGVVTLFQAMAMHFITGLEEDSPVPNASKKQSIQTKDQVLNFLKKYGARPYFEEAPMVRSGYYEMFLAYQRFCLLWASQFQATFQTTFMPEIYPGGLIAFPEHGIQMFVEEVSHNMDYENGFTTTIQFVAPAALKNGPGGVHDGMIRADALT